MNLDKLPLPTESQIQDIICGLSRGNEISRLLNENREAGLEAFTAYFDRNPLDYDKPPKWYREAVASNCYHHDPTTIVTDEITGLTYGYPIDRVLALAQRARLARARERYPWLPGNYKEREALKYGPAERSVLDIMRGHFARSLSSTDVIGYDLTKHPDFLTYAAAYLATNRDVMARALGRTPELKAAAVLLGVTPKASPHLPPGYSEWRSEANQ